MELGSKCKKCRRVGEKLFLKGDRCFTQKCAIVRKPYAPGAHGTGKKRKSSSEYGTQLNEKQKVKRSYYLRENQFRKYFEMASKRGGVTGDTLLQILETRLDNVVFRGGLAGSRSSAKQMVGHGHISINGKRVDIPSILVRVGDKVSIRKGSAEKVIFKDLKEKLKKFQPASWMELDKDNLVISINRIPQKDDVSSGFNMQLITEFYSR
ncbi:30S ribosomal protein S4 [Candidatus Azambacteria bacterium]|nr:30S ribosomal protein S4 [Candidatus Azambacteria bacterium]